MYRRLPSDIADFRVAPYDFLSNMYSTPIKTLGYTFECAESAFQAHKNLHKGYVHQFAGLNGYEAKRLGRTVPLRSDWPETKLAVMAHILALKFPPGHPLSAKLVDTGNARLIEGNTWNDAYWGVCNGKGHNHLGELLMKRRTILRG